MVSIQLTPEETFNALRLAGIAHELWKGQKGHYGDNQLRRHQIGKLGEAAVAKHLGTQGIDCDRAFESVERENEADVITGKARLEVKTWSLAFWDSGGRCVTPKQLPYIQKKADIVVWCTLTKDVHDGEVDLRGWSTVEEVVAQPVRLTSAGRYRDKPNHQIDEPDMHDISDLVARVR